jgi:formylglycine-generating enzyme required for sulfatase activity
MNKRVIIALMMALMPIIASAQGAGGQIRRTVKKQQTTTNEPSKKASPKKEKPTSSSQSSIAKPNNQTPSDKKLSKPSTEEILQSLVNNMVYIEGGTFTMGATSEQGSDAYVGETPHQVTVSSFSIGKYEVTQEEWAAVMENNPSCFKGAKRPVENVSWSECRQFIRKLKAMTGKNFRMLTEAEWEYAARGGKKSRGYKYSGSNILDDVGWYDVNSSKETHEVGQLDPNELGLYDMSGNVFEWCLDWDGSYDLTPQNNPIGPNSGSLHIFRGGSWGYRAVHCRVSFRLAWAPGATDNRLGLRLAL